MAISSGCDYRSVRRLTRLLGIYRRQSDGFIYSEVAKVNVRHIGAVNLPGQ